MRVEQRWPVWVRYVLLQAFIVILYYLAGFWSSRPFQVAQVALYSAVSLLAAGALLAGQAWHRPASRSPWLLLAAGQFLAFVADTVGNIRHELLGLIDFPSIADAFYFLRYLPLLAALILFTRRRSPGRDVASLLDAAVIAVGFALLSWVFLLDPNVSAPGLSFALRIGVLYQPVMDIAVLSLGLRLLIGAGARTPSFHLFTASMSVNLAANSVLGLQVLAGTYLLGDTLNASWLVADLLLGACALHPSMTRMSEPAATLERRVGRGRLTLLGAASLTAPLMLVVQQQAKGHVSLRVNAVTSAVLFLLVIARMAGLIRASQQAAVTDSLTGLYNRRFFEEQLSLETQRAARGGWTIGLLIIDVDWFKAVNDTYGHPAGDQVLREVARRLKSELRGYDVVARYGGEEFAVLIWDVDDDTLLGLGERLRTAVSASAIELDGDQRLTVTVSVGVANGATDPADTDPKRAAALVQAADRALYEAKRAGRDRCVVATPDLSPVPQPRAGRLPATISSG